MIPKPFTHLGGVVEVLVAANIALKEAFEDGYTPQSISHQVSDLNGWFKLTLAWRTKAEKEKPLEFGYSNDIGDYARGGVFSSTKWSEGFSLNGVDWYIGLRIKR
jgi:hypothetical protein